MEAVSVKTILALVVILAVGCFALFGVQLLTDGLARHVLGFAVVVGLAWLSWDRFYSWDKF